MTRDLEPFLGYLDPISGDAEQVAHIAFTDYLALMLSASHTNDDASPLLNGTAGLAARLAARASARDLDDVDWSGMNHPGAVIWSAALAVAATRETPGPQILAAGIAGYQVAAYAAALFGADHARRWHITATAGALGASVAASVAAGHSRDVVERALAFAMLNLGGLGQAPLERSGAARMTRAASAALGVVSAGMATEDMPDVRHPWSGPRGAQAVLLGQDAEAPREVTPWPSIGLRLFPVTGFVHAAVRATAQLGPQPVFDVHEVVWELSEPAIALVGGADHGDWWNARLAAARAIGTGDPFHVDVSGPWDSLVDRIRLEPSELRVGDAKVIMRSVSGEQTVQAHRSTVLESPDAMADVRMKCAQVLGIDPGDPQELTALVLAPEPDWRQIRATLSL